MDPEKWNCTTSRYVYTYTWSFFIYWIRTLTLIFVFSPIPFFPSLPLSLRNSASQKPAAYIYIDFANKANCHCFHTIENRQPHAHCHVLSPHWGTPTRAPACAFTATHAYGWVTHWRGICIESLETTLLDIKEFKTDNYEPLLRVKIPPKKQQEPWPV